MSQILEIEGRTIDEAIFAGLEQMGVSFDEVDIDIIESGNKGFLGIGSKQAKVKLTKRDETQAATTPKEYRSNLPGTRPAQSERPQPRRENIPPRTFTPVTAPTTPKEINGTPMEETHPAIVFIKNVLALMKVDASVKGTQTDDALHIFITGVTTGQLIGYRGETLDSLQYLTSLILNKDKPDYTRVLLDTGDYRAKREQTLVRLAQHLAMKAVKSGHKVNLEPMNPYERRIIHSALQNNHRVTTASEGEEPNRRVIITPKRSY